MKHYLYRHFNTEGRLLYVGISRDASKRLAQHRAHAPWFDEIATVDVTAFETREKAAEAERRAIQKERPVHNVFGSPWSANASRPKRGVSLVWNVTPSTRLAVKTLASRRHVSLEALLFEAVADLFAKYDVTPDEDGYANLLRRIELGIREHA